MSTNARRPDKSDGTTQTALIDGDLGELIVRTVAADPAADGARVGAVMLRAVRDAPGEIDVGHVSKSMDALVDQGVLERDGERLYLEADR